MTLEQFLTDYVNSDQAIYISSLPGHHPVVVGVVRDAENGYYFTDHKDALLYFGEDTVVNVGGYLENALRIIVKEG